MGNKRKLLVDQLTRKLEPFSGTEKIIVPDPGWIYTIRKALNISLEQLAQKLHITRQGVKKLEEREANGAITLKSLKEAGNAMHLQLVYGFVPLDGSIEQLIDRKAAELARKIVMRTHQHMQLENQGNTDERLEKAIHELTIELKKEMNKALWD